MDTSITQTARAAKRSFEYSDWKEKLARVGHVAKGSVYGCAGVLTFLAAVNLGGQKAGKMQVLKFLKDQPFGTLLLIMMALGLACYAFFRFIQAVGKSESLQQKSKGKRRAMKAGFVVSGLLYMGLAGASIAMVFGSSGGSGKSQQGYVSQILSHSWGPVLIYIAAALLLIKAIVQFYKVYKGDYFHGIRSSGKNTEKAEKLVKNMGAAGFISRGILITVIAWFVFQAANQHDPSEVQGSSGAFSYLEQSTFGPWLMGVVAAGLICYGVYMLIVARYKQFHIR